jgi:hypothetical protein
MHLWNDYEGKTIAEAYPLERLLRPEGRSAFFATGDASGTPQVIRLTESLNDEDEILERLRQVSEVHQENLVEIKLYGQTTFDGVALTYALMEPTDASLSEILTERPLTVAETKEVALSLVAALTALHGQGLIHEHIEPANVLASGDIIKLRSDCVRECVLDGEFTTAAMVEDLKQKDVQDLATLLLRCLTLEKRLTPATRLGAPFDKIVPNAMNGSWGLAEIQNSLTPPVFKPLVPESVVSARPAPTVTFDSAKENAKPARAAFVENAEPVRVEAAPLQTALPFSEDGPTLRVRRLNEEETDEAAAAWTVPEWVKEGWASVQARVETMDRKWIYGGAGVLILALLVWLVLPGGKASKAASIRDTAKEPVADRIQTIDDAPAGPSGMTAAGPSRGRGSAAATEAAKSVPAARAKESVAVEARGEAGFRVICYTFSHEDQAWSRAGAIRKVHPGLSPKVFAAGARGPYLITLGGVVSRGEAEAMVKRARRDGLPRDTFARFYPAR